GDRSKAARPRIPPKPTPESIRKGRAGKELPRAWRAILDRRRTADLAARARCALDFDAPRAWSGAPIRPHVRDRSALGEVSRNRSRKCPTLTAKASSRASRPGFF